MEVKLRTAKSLITKLSSVSEQTRTEALCELRLMTKHDPDSRPIIAESGAVPYLMETLYSDSPLTQENGAATLLNLSISSRHLLMSTRGLLDALSHALSHPSAPSAAQSAAATLYSLLVVDDYRPIIGAKRDILYALISILKNPNSPARSIKDSLKALFGIALYPLNRAALIGLGAVPPLFSLVVKDGRIGIVEDLTAVIAQVAGCEEAADAFKGSGIRVLIDLLDPATGSSVRTVENAVSALLNLVRCGGERVVDEIILMGLGVMDWILDVMEKGSTKGKNKAASLLELLDGRSNQRFDLILDKSSS